MAAAAIPLEQGWSELKLLNGPALEVPRPGNEPGHYRYRPRRGRLSGFGFCPA